MNKNLGSLIQLNNLIVLLSWLYAILSRIENYIENYIENVLNIHYNNMKCYLLKKLSVTNFSLLYLSPSYFAVAKIYILCH